MIFRLRALLPLLVLLWLAVPSALRADPETPAQANKRLFDRTVDELNFRAMETVYDKSFARGKFPSTLRTAKARKDFTEYFGRTDLQTLFQNYNGVSDRFKGRFGKGRTDLVEFEKQLNSILVDKNFEFFIRVLPRDERVALVRSLQRVIKQASAQFNASEDAAPEDLAEDGAAVPPADAPLTTAAAEETAAPSAAATAELTASEALARSAHAAQAPARHDWVDYLTLLLAGSSALLLLYLVTSVLPDLRTRLDALTDDLDQARPSASPRPRRRAGLPDDRYEDEEEGN